LQNALGRQAIDVGSAADKLLPKAA
jgi:hypothetical protein